MISRYLIISGLLSCSLAQAEPTPDLLRFTNGDRLHGKFSGFNSPDEILWKRDDLAKAVSFKTQNLRQLILQGGESEAAAESISYIELINGDQIPGKVTAIDADSVTITSETSGTLKIPRKAVSLIAPNPLGGPVSYHGPFTPDGWEMIHPKHPQGLPAEKPTDKPKGDKSEQPGRWQFSGSAWYWKDSRMGTALARQNCMPEHSILRFKLAWKNELRLAIALHADSALINDGDKDGDPPQAAALSPHDSMMYPHLFGNSLILQLNSNYIVLYRSTVDGEKGPEVKRINVNSNRIRLGENSNAVVEVRSNREKGNLSLYIDDAFVMQWAGIDPLEEDEKKSIAEGSDLGFLSQANDSQLKISEIVIAEWNGMPDSARSLGVDHRDIAMMVNGLDRYAGEIIGMTDDNLMQLKGKYGAFKLPINEISEIRFAKNQLAEKPKSLEGRISIRLSPVGIISGKPVSGDESSITLDNPFAGNIKLPTESAIMLEFNTKPSSEDNDWNIGL